MSCNVVAYSYCGLKCAREIFPKEYTPINSAINGATAANEIPNCPSKILDRKLLNSCKDHKNKSSKLVQL